MCPGFSCLDLVRCEPRCTWCWFPVYAIKESLLREKKLHSNVGPKRELRNREKDKERNHDREINMEILWVVSEKKKKSICMALPKGGKSDHNSRSSLLTLS